MFFTSWGAMYSDEAAVQVLVNRNDLPVEVLELLEQWLRSLREVDPNARDTSHRGFAAEAAAE